jgi:phosphohistidine phosphatase
MMRLYLVRHGQAQPPEADQQRRLTSKGDNDTRKVARMIAPMDIRVAAIWHSGESRAKQTAEILASAVRAAHGVQNRKGLTPDADPHKAAGVVANLQDDLMIVSHLPFIGRLAGLLLTQPTGPADDHDQEEAAVEAANAKATVARSLAGVTRWLDQRAQHLAQQQEAAPIADLIAFRHSCVVCLERRLGSHWKIAWMVLPDASPAADDARPEPVAPSQFRSHAAPTTEQVRQQARSSARPNHRTVDTHQRTVLDVSPVDEMESSIGRRIGPNQREIPYPDLTASKNLDPIDLDDEGDQT